MILLIKRGNSIKQKINIFLIIKELFVLNINLIKKKNEKNQRLILYVLKIILKTCRKRKGNVL